MLRCTALRHFFIIPVIASCRIAFVFVASQFCGFHREKTLGAKLSRIISGWILANQAGAGAGYWSCKVAGAGAGAEKPEFAHL